MTHIQFVPTITLSDQTDRSWEWIKWSPKDEMLQGAKKVIFTACHSGKLKLTFTSPNIISTSPKNVWMSRLISLFVCNLNSSKHFTCLLGRLITEFTSPIAKSASPRLLDTTFLARWCCDVWTNSLKQDDKECTKNSVEKMHVDVGS